MDIVALLEVLVKGLLHHLHRILTTYEYFLRYYIYKLLSCQKRY